MACSVVMHGITTLHSLGNKVLVNVAMILHVMAWYTTLFELTKYVSAQYLNIKLKYK